MCFASSSSAIVDAEVDVVHDATITPTMARRDITIPFDSGPRRPREAHESRLSRHRVGPHAEGVVAPALAVDLHEKVVPSRSLHYDFSDSIDSDDGDGSVAS